MTYRRQCCGRRSRESSPDVPVLLGNENGVTVRCRVLIPFAGMHVYHVGYFTGDGVDDRIAARVLEAV